MNANTLRIRRFLKNLLGSKEQSSRIGTNNLLNRDHWIQTKLKELPPGWRVLDAGAGEQPYRQFCSHLKYVSQDFAEYDGKEDGGLQVKNWEYGKLDIVSDVTNIPEKDASFDAILCTEVIEHIPNPVNVFPEFSRLLKSGGYLLLTSPFCSLTHFAPYHFCTGFSRYFYETHLQNNGFEIVEIEANGNYFEYLAQEVRRISSIASRYADDELTSAEVKAKHTLLAALNRFSGKNLNSEELLCYGYHVLAKKK